MTAWLPTTSRLLPFGWHRGAIRHFASGLITNSTSTLETVSRRPEHFAVIPSGIPASWCTRPTPDRLERRGPLRVGMVGRIAPWKGQHVFLAAFAEAFPDGGAEAVISGLRFSGRTHMRRSSAGS